MKKTTRKRRKFFYRENRNPRSRGVSGEFTPADGINSVTSKGYRVENQNG